MSSKLVRKALQESLEFDDARNDDDDDATRRSTTKKTAATIGGRGGRKKRKTTKATVATTTDELVRERIDRMLRFDRYAAQKNDSAARASSRRTDAARRDGKMKRRARMSELEDGDVVNSRSSSSWYARRPREKTFDKERARKERKRKSIEDIAALMKKTRAKKKSKT